MWAKPGNNVTACGDMFCLFIFRAQWVTQYVVFHFYHFPLLKSLLVTHTDSRALNLALDSMHFSGGASHGHVWLPRRNASSHDHFFIPCNYCELTNCATSPDEEENCPLLVAHQVLRCRSRFEAVFAILPDWFVALCCASSSSCLLTLRPIPAPPRLTEGDTSVTIRHLRACF